MSLGRLINNFEYQVFQPIEYQIAQQTNQAAYYDMGALVNGTCWRAFAEMTLKEKTVTILKTITVFALVLALSFFTSFISIPFAIAAGIMTFAHLTNKKIEVSPQGGGPSS